MTIRARRSSSNVFRDLGFGEDEAENLKVRADLMIELTKLIEAQGLAQRIYPEHHRGGIGQGGEDRR